MRVFLFNFTIMKHIVLLITMLILFSSCNYQKSWKKNLSTGMTVKAQGLSLDDVDIFINEKKENRNEFIFGETVQFLFQNIEGFESIEDSLSIGMSMLVLNQQADTMLFANDLLQNYKINNEGAVKLTASMSPAFTYTNQEQYHVNIHVWDKQGEGSLDMDMPFSIQENTNFTIENNQLFYDKLYFYDNTDDNVIIDNQIYAQHQTQLIFKGVENFETIDGLVYPALSILAKDSAGNELINQENLLAQITTQGIDPSRIFSKIPVALFFQGDIQNPVELVAQLTDTKSDRLITLTTTVTIIEE